ncbi:MAG: DUF4845 domain-containing protein [Betaproteobacteria bacterium]|nr:DUF4845 domain-containing protein [Betaproteobacteria bacterium]
MMHQRQRGLSLIGTLIIGVIIIGAIILAMRCVPVYNEYFSVKSAFNKIATSGDLDSPETIKSAFQRYADVGDISSIATKDLVIAKENGRYVVSAQWERRVSLVANVALVFSFETSSRAAASNMP